MHTSHVIKDEKEEKSKYALYQVQRLTTCFEILFLQRMKMRVPSYDVHQSRITGLSLLGAFSLKLYRPKSEKISSGLIPEHKHIT